MAEIIVPDMGRPDPGYDANVPRWEAHFGNNNHRVHCNERWGGGISFTEHIGKPLTPDLWKDLVGRCQVTGIEVFHVEDFVWTIGRSGMWVRIHLDANLNVREIKLYP